MDYELDITGSVSIDQINQALDNYNSVHSISFSVSGSEAPYSLIGGDDVYAEGDLQQIAFYWEGYVSGQMDGDTSLNISAYDEGD